MAEPSTSQQKGENLTGGVIKTAAAREVKKKKGSGSGGIGHVLTQSIRVLVRGIFSPDAPTRRVTFLFFLSATGLAVTLVIGIRRGTTLIHEHTNPSLMTESDLYGDGADAQASPLPLPETRSFLGRYIFELEKIPPSSSPSDTQDMLNVVEVEIVAQCDRKETCEYLH